jgi:hypothetical protein
MGGCAPDQAWRCSSLSGFLRWCGVLFALVLCICKVRPLCAVASGILEVEVLYFHLLFSSILHYYNLVIVVE